MNNSPAKYNPLTDLNVFLAYSLALEEESAERLREVADMMMLHQQHDLEALFLKLARYSDKHGDEVRQICGDTELPDIKPWDFDWPGMEPPETCDYAAISYQMAPREALVNMLLLERNTAAFYQDIASRSSNLRIVELAREFANEETAHATAIEEWLHKLPIRAANAVDIDPPREPC